MNRHPLAALLDPASVAVVGASEDRNTVGGALLHNLRNGFKGPVHAVNPRRQTIGGMPAYAALVDLPAPVDLAVIAAPPQAAELALEDCGKLAIPAAAILNSQADSLVPALAAARRHGVRVLGPNSLGVMRPVSGLNATFAASGARPGTVALVAQSGAMVSTVLDWADVDEVGFSSVVSLGNKADVDFADVLDFLTFDPQTESIVLYVEGVRNARKFLSGLRAASRTKPVIVLKSGREQAGSRAAATHTGSLAVRDDVFDAALRRSGAVRVRTLVQLFSAAKCLASRYRPTENRMAIVTNGGGPGVMAADRAAELGLEIATLHADTVTRLHQALPPGWSGANPVDLLEDAGVERFQVAFDACLKDPEAEGVLVIVAPLAMTRPLEVAEAVVNLSRGSSKHVFACWMGDRSMQPARHALAVAGIPVFRTPEPAVEAFANVASYYENQQQLVQVPGSLVEPEAPDIHRACELIEQTLLRGREHLSEVECTSLLEAFRIPVVPARVASSPSEAARLAQEVGFPIAMKIQAGTILHKEAGGAVRLWIDTPAATRAAYDRIVSEFRLRMPDVPVEGVIVQPMVDKPGAAACLMGIFTDPVFGPIVMLGTGGTNVELIADRAVALPPLNRFLARRLILATRMGKLLASQCREAEIIAIEDALLRVSELACELPQLLELDINPFIVDPKGGMAADARAVIRRLPARPQGGRYAHMAVHPYPMDLIAHWISPSGVQVEIRPIRPEDAQIERDFVRRLSAESRYFRFIGALSDLSNRMLVRFTQIDYDREMALIAVTHHGRDVQIGVARYSIQSDGESCEFALVVDDAWQGQGLGSRLMRALMGAAAAKGLRRIEGFVLQNNVKMLGLMHKLGFEIRTDPDDASLKLVTKHLVTSGNDIIM